MSTRSTPASYDLPTVRPAAALLGKDAALSPHVRVRHTHLADLADPDATTAGPLASVKSHKSDDDVTNGLGPSSAGVPSPFLSALSMQAVSFFAVCTVMAAVGIIRWLPQIDADAGGLFWLYYQPLIPLAAMLWMWAIAVKFFEDRAVKYDVCFSVRDQARLLPSRSIFQLASLASAAVFTSGALFVYYCSAGAAGMAAWQPPLVYGGLIAFLLFPNNIVYKETRMFFSATVFRVVTPYRDVTWADFLLADVLTSLSKPLADMERAACHLLTGPVMDPSERFCSGASWLGPLFQALPYVWRFCQCIRVVLDTGADAQRWNALKYATAFPAIVCWGMRPRIADDEWDGFWKYLWLLFSLINSCFSYFWDIERDWDIQWFTASSGDRLCPGIRRPQLNKLLLYPVGFYFYLIVSNLVLRFTWTYKLTGLFGANWAIMLFTLLEAYRRFQWVPVRVEVEMRKLQAQRPELGQLVPAPASGEGKAKGLAESEMLLRGVGTA